MNWLQKKAPKIYSWLAIFANRFERMRRGWFRLHVVIYCAALVAMIVAAANSSREVDQETFAGIIGAIFWLYWPIVRICLWIYDGFKKEKAASPIKLDSNGDNRNN